MAAGVMNGAAMLSGSPTLSRIRADLKQARSRLAIARLDADAERIGAAEADIERLRQAETRAEALLRHRDHAHRKPTRTRRRRVG